MDDTWRRILKCYLDLNLDFLDEDELDEDPPTKGAPTSGIGMASAKWSITSLYFWTSIIILYIFTFIIPLASLIKMTNL